MTDEHKLTTRERVVGELQNRPSTASELAARILLHRNTADYHLRRLQKEEKCHISGWRRQKGNQGDWGAIYKFGPGVNKAPPVRNKADERRYSQRYYQRVKLRRAQEQAARTALGRGEFNPFTQLLVLSNAN